MPPPHGRRGRPASPQPEPGPTRPSPSASCVCTARGRPRQAPRRHRRSPRRPRGDLRGRPRRSAGPCAAEVRHDSTCAEADQGRDQGRDAVPGLRRCSPRRPAWSMRADHGLARAVSVEALEARLRRGGRGPARRRPCKTAAQRLHWSSSSATVDAAQAAYGGIADSVLALVPSDFPSSGRHAGQVRGPTPARARPHWPRPRPTAPFWRALLG